MSDLTAARLREIVSFDPDTGKFVYLTRTAARVRAGDDAGWLNRTSGYRQISIDCRQYQAHRLAWLWMTGEWPGVEVDHRNGNRSDNCWSNLRLATHQGNAENRRRARRGSTSGLLGVRLVRSGRWNARICVNGRPMHLGTHDTPEAAHAAYVSAKRRLHAGCTI